MVIIIIIIIIIIIKNSDMRLDGLQIHFWAILENKNYLTPITVWKYITENIVWKDKQCTNDVTLSHDRVTIVAVEKQ
jgi:hypothetical protein